MMFSSCMLVGRCGVRFLMRTPYRTLDRRRFGMRMVGMLLVLSAFCVFPLRPHASLPRTHNWLFSLTSASCLGLRPPAAMTDGRFSPMKAISSADLCNQAKGHYVLRQISFHRTMNCHLILSCLILRKTVLLLLLLLLLLFLFCLYSRVWVKRHDAL